MNTERFVSQDTIRAQFSGAMSLMYREEVPQYGMLLDLVKDGNAEALAADSALRKQMLRHGDIDRLNVERHGAIRLGTAAELSMMRRVFAVMGMHPVGYYDLSVAGVPVHATAFRPIDDAALQINPFRVFTSLLRLELITDEGLRAQAEAILARRQIFSARAISLVEKTEAEGGLEAADAKAFVREIQETFRWHSEATVDASTYQRLAAAHRLIADVVSFKGPHINHLTPRTLDIDAVQMEMPRRGISAKDVIEGPPARKHPILLRQTSFKALDEPIAFPSSEGASQSGSHTARFGEVEQRGMALTPAGRALYDQLLACAREPNVKGNATQDYSRRLAEVFTAFPDELDTLRARGLAFFRYAVCDETAFTAAAKPSSVWNLDQLLKEGIVEASPIVYEDFLPVSAAGIFQSNLGGAEQQSYQANAAKAAFEANLDAPVLDEMTLYASAQDASEGLLKARFLKIQERG